MIFILSFFAVHGLGNIEWLTQSKLETLELANEPAVLFGKSSPRKFVKIAGTEDAVAYADKLIRKKLFEIDEKLKF
jgi:hypothetical protein